MAGVDLKKFSELGFLQSIDIDGLVKVLAPYSTYFAGQGLDITALRNDDASARQLHTVFTRADEDTPRELLDVLYTIGDLADDVGHDKIMLYSMQARLDMTWATDRMTPGDFVIGTYIRHPHLVRNCAALVARKIKNYTEYRAKDDTKLTLDNAMKGSEAIAKLLSPWFESKKRSPVCQVHAYQDGHEIRFVVTHGLLYRSDGTISNDNEMERVAFRPQQHDAVIFDNRTFTLKVNARTPGERGIYRTTFGQVLFGDVDHFPGLGIYTLAPLRVEPLSFRPVVGIKDNGIVLTEVWIEYASDDHRVEKYQSDDLLISIGTEHRPNLQAGTLIRASLMIRYSSGGRARKLELRPPNIAIYDHDRDGDVTEEFLKRNGFMLVAAPAQGGTDDDGPDGPGVDGD